MVPWPYDAGVTTPTGVWLLTEELYILDGVTLQVKNDRGSGHYVLSCAQIWLPSYFRNRFEAIENNFVGQAWRGKATCVTPSICLQRMSPSNRSA